MSIVRPGILLDFLNARALDPRLSFTRPAGTNGRATYFDALGNMTDVPANVPRFDHSLDGVPLGLLKEIGITNYNFNPRNEGAGGTALTSGNMPTNQSMTGALNGVTISRQADQVRRGMNGMVLRFGGTASAATTIVLRCCTTDPSASSGQNWTLSGYAQIVAGGLAGASSIKAQMLSVGGAAITEEDLTAQLSGTEPYRARATIVTDAGTTAARSQWEIFIPSGISPSFDLWIGPTQLENRSTPSSQVLPPLVSAGGNIGATSARGTEQITAQIADFGLTGLASEGSIVVSWRNGPADMTVTQIIFILWDGSSDNQVQLQRLSVGNTRLVHSSGSTNFVSTSLVISPSVNTAADTIYTAGIVWGGPNKQNFLNGQVGTSPAGVAPLALNQLILGNNNTNTLNGHLRRFVIYPRRLSNAVMQSLTG